MNIGLFKNKEKTIMNGLDNKKTAMMNNNNQTSFYITFGQVHKHEIGDLYFDRDCVCEIEADSYEIASTKVHDAFDNKWCMIYTDVELVGMHFYPRGIIKLQEIEIKTAACSTEKTRKSRLA